MTTLFLCPTSTMGRGRSAGRGLSVYHCAEAIVNDFRISLELRGFESTKTENAPAEAAVHCLRENGSYESAWRLPMG